MNTNLDVASINNCPVFSAILITPEQFGITGRCYYASNGAWLFFTDNDSHGNTVGTQRPRSEIYIPRLDKTKTITQPSHG